MEKIKEAGYKLTPVRIAVYSLLIKHDGIVSAKGLHEKLEKYDLSTVYRTLNIFSASGLIYEEKIAGESYYYLSDKQHHHIICRKCGQTKCVPCNENFENIKGFSEIRHQLAISGICDKCKAVCSK